MAVEEPAFTVVLQEGDLSIRSYSARIAAEVVVAGDRDDASSAGFRLLAGYIFGGNTKRQKIDMTAPVVQTAQPGQDIAMTAPVTQSGSPGAWTIRFLMPREYSLDQLPVPNDKKVRLLELPPARFAVVRFSGMAGVADVAQRTAELSTFVEARKLKIKGPFSLARYNPPWTLWFMRRNEVMVEVE